MHSSHECPFCRSFDIRTLFQAEDGLDSYRCHDCERTFHSRLPTAPATGKDGTESAEHRPASPPRSEKRVGER